MFRSRKLSHLAALCLILAGALLSHGRAFAHGHIEVGEYSFSVGFLNEPAYLGQPNAVYLAVTHHAGEDEHAAGEAAAGATQEATAEATEVGHAEDEEHDESEESADDHAAGEPVLGLEETLSVEIIKGDQSQTLEFRPLFGVPGTYVADVLPTETGDYTFRIFGSINGTPVDETMTSGPDTFSSVEPTDSIAFPVDSAGSQNQTALYVGIAGVALGLFGTVLGVMGLRRKSG
jgi:hypothetical protein